MDQTNVLFVPYRPGKAVPKISGEISQQKHAAREYHRKAKERRQSTKQSIADDTNFNLQSDVRVPLQRAKSATAVPTPSMTSPGGGRADPFNSFAVGDMSPYAQEMLDYALTYQWPLWSFCNPGATIHDMKRYNMGKVMSSATFMYCLVFAGATHHALSRYGTEVSQENIMLRLNYKTRALRSMCLDIESAGSQVSMEAMKTMLLLSAHGAAEKVQPPRAAENDRPLAKAHMLDFYSRLPFEWAHLNALFTLVKQQGGLVALPKSSFTKVISMADIMTSFQTLSNPQFPLLKSCKSILTTWPTTKHDGSSLARLLGSSFGRLPKSNRFDSLKSVVKNIGTITVGYDRYQNGHFDAPILHQILLARLAALHDLLSLPTSSVNTAENCLYELCRHSTLAYMALAIFPVSRRCGLHEELAKRIMALLDNADSFDLWSSYSKFLLWATVMGGVMARNTPLRAWFVNYLNSSGVKHTLVAWPPFNNLLTTCLWLDSECDVEGLSLWNEAWDVTLSRAASV